MRRVSLVELWNECCNLGGKFPPSHKEMRSQLARIQACDIEEYAASRFEAWFSVVSKIKEDGSSWCIIVEPNSKKSVCRKSTPNQVLLIALAEADAVLDNPFAEAVLCKNGLLTMLLSRQTVKTYMGSKVSISTEANLIKRLFAMYDKKILRYETKHEPLPLKYATIYNRIATTLIKLKTYMIQKGFWNTYAKVDLEGTTHSSRSDDASDFYPSPSATSYEDMCGQYMPVMPGSRFIRTPSRPARSEYSSEDTGLSTWGSISGVDIFQTVSPPKVPRRPRNRALRVKS